MPRPCQLQPCCCLYIRLCICLHIVTEVWTSTRAFLLDLGIGPKVGGFRVERREWGRVAGNKYEVLMLDDPEAEDEENPKIAFQIVTASSLKPEPIGIGQRGLALALLISTMYTCFQLGAICDASHYSGVSGPFLSAPALPALSGRLL